MFLKFLLFFKMKRLIYMNYLQSEMIFFSFLYDWLTIFVFLRGLRFFKMITNKIKNEVLSILAN